MAALLRVLLVIVIILIPVWLSDLTGGFLTQPKPKAIEASKPTLKLRSEVRIDRAAFLASFSRQANTDLVPCLRKSLGEAGSITLIARLRPQGHLSGIRIIEPRGLDCANDAIQAMDFTRIAQALGTDGSELAWRFDW